MAKGEKENKSESCPALLPIFSIPHVVNRQGFVDLDELRCFSLSEFSHGQRLLSSVTQNLFSVSFATLCSVCLRVFMLLMLVCRLSEYGKNSAEMLPKYHLHFNL